MAASAGASHSIIALRDGRALTFGCGGGGRLGHGGEETEWTPRAVESLSGVVAVSTGANTTAAMDGEGRVFTFGAGGPALGHGDDELPSEDEDEEEEPPIQTAPRQVEGLRGTAAGAFAT